MIDERYGVFVSPNGDDDRGDGSREAPYETLGKAVDEAASSGRRVYACADGGSFQENLSLDGTANGMELFGGFSCDDWTYDESRKTAVTSPGPLALRVRDASGLRIEDFAFEAASATGPGDSSVGAFVVSSTGIVLRRLRIRAGNAEDGASGMAQAFEFPSHAMLDGNSAMLTVGADEKVCTCPGGGITTGGSGGDAAVGGKPGDPGTPDFGAGNGGTPPGCTNGFGKEGGAAPPAEAAAGATMLGALSSSGWTPASGENGASGSPGQGGGGGASSATGGGGGGGCGGCGGAGGKAGSGGGASLALISFESELDIVDSELIAQHAGAGGAGTVGQDGQMEGGFGGSQATGGCQGGAGGPGGIGGAAGGGAGGISIGILWKGDVEPATSGTTTITFGSAGAKGTGGDPGMNDGIPGVARQVLEIL